MKVLLTFELLSSLALKSFLSLLWDELGAPAYLQIETLEHGYIWMEKMSNSQILRGKMWKMAKSIY
jgi:hypothetical protein